MVYGIFGGAFLLLWVVIGKFRNLRTVHVEWGLVRLEFEPAKEKTPRKLRASREIRDVVR